MNENYQTPLFRIALRRSIPVRNRPWNHPFEYTRAEQKRNKPHRTKGRAWKERKKTRSVHSRLSLVAPPPDSTRRNSRFHGGERKRFIGSVRTRKVSQPTNELLVHRGWTTERERGREKEQDFSEAWKLIDRRTRLSLFRDEGTPTHLLRLLFVAASSPVKTN